MALRSGHSVSVEDLVEGEQAGRLGAVHRIPPVAHEVLLVENGPRWTEHRVLATVRVADVENLREKEMCLFSMNECACCQ